MLTVWTIAFIASVAWFVITISFAWFVADGKCEHCMSWYLTTKHSAVEYQPANQQNVKVPSVDLT